MAQRQRIRLQYGRPGFNPWVGKVSWRRVWPPTVVFLPGEFHGQRSLAGYSPGVAKETYGPNFLACFILSQESNHSVNKG